MRKLPPSGPLDKKGTSANKDRMTFKHFQASSNISKQFPASKTWISKHMSHLHPFVAPKLEELVRHLGIEGDGVCPAVFRLMG